MALLVKHPFVSGKSDGGDATFVQPSNWNASHTITAAVDNLLGTDSGSTTAKEIPCTAFGRSQIAAADLATWLSSTALQGSVMTWTGVQTVNAKFTAGQDFYLVGFITPTILAADTNDWAPTSLATASRIRASASVAVAVTGLTGGAEGRVIVLDNVGSFQITLKSQNASSTAANRFVFTQDVILHANESTTLIYDGTSLRWRAQGRVQLTTPTIQNLTSGTTYNRPDGCTLIKVRAVAAGGGRLSGVGGTTSFNSVTAIGGSPGAAHSGNTGGVGGIGGTGGAGTALRWPGSVGSDGGVGTGAGSGIGGMGGASMFSGAGAPTAKIATANSGSGSGGASQVAAGGDGGGGAGEYFELYIGSPAATYTYAIGAGTDGGASGRIVVEEFYS